MRKRIHPPSCRGTVTVTVTASSSAVLPDQQSSPSVRPYDHLNLHTDSSKLRSAFSSMYFACGMQAVRKRLEDYIGSLIRDIGPLIRISTRWSLMYFACGEQCLERAAKGAGAKRPKSVVRTMNRNDGRIMSFCDLPSLA